MPTTYYSYKDPFPAALNHPLAIQQECTADWPKVFRVNSNFHSYYQGVHVAAPIYTANQPATQGFFYYGAQQQPAPGGYYVNGQFYAAAAPSGMTSTFPSSHEYLYRPAMSAYSATSSSALAPFSYAARTYPSTIYHPSVMNFPCFANKYSYNSPLAPPGPAFVPMTAQAAQAAAMNAALAAAPTASGYFVGNPADFSTQQAVIAAQYAQMNLPKAPPKTLAPYKPADGQQFWCKELDGSWTLRTHTEIVMGEVNPGHWERHATSGYFYWVRSLA